MAQTRVLFCLGLAACFLQPTRTQTVSTDPDDIAFYLYPNPADLQDTDTLVFGDPFSVASSRFVPGKALILLIHGFAQNYTTVFPQVVKDAYLQNGYEASANIIAVDWGLLATPVPVALLPWSDDVLTQQLSTALVLLGYPLAEANTAVTAQRVGDFIEFLLNAGFLVPSDLGRAHFIGMSMGAHVAGISAQQVQQDTGLTVARVTGLDPAGPLYQGVPASDRLSSTDAAYVDVVHTNQGEFGYVGSLGIADYYVNGGGPLQPGCSLLPTSVDGAFCSHAKSIYYYAASISNSSLRGCKCLLSSLGLICLGTAPCTAFGEGSPSSARGCYCLSLTTNP